MDNKALCTSSDSSCPQMASGGLLSSAVSLNNRSLPLTLLAHALTTGTALVVLGVISGLTCSILALKSYSKLRSNENDESRKEEKEGEEDEEEEEEEDQQASSFKHSTFIFQKSCILPLESMGLSYNCNPLLSTLGSMLKRAAPFMLHLSRSVNDALLTIIICLPIGLYYLTWITLARLNPQVQGKISFNLISYLYCLPCENYNPILQLDVSILILMFHTFPCSHIP